MSGGGNDDSDDEVRVLFEGIPDQLEEPNDGEPPRRRMRMDPDAQVGSANPSLPLSGLGMSLTSRSIPRQGHDPPPSTSGVLYPPSPGPEEFELDFDLNEDLVDNDSIFGDDLIPIFSPNMYTSTPLLFSVTSSPSNSSLYSGISNDLSGSPPLLNLDFDLDTRSTAGSFESYNPDDLSDVTVDRVSEPETPSSVSEGEDSADGESLFGPQSNDSAPAQGEVGADPDPDPGAWERRRLQRRNAIVLDTTDNGSDGEHEQEEEQRGDSMPSEPAPVKVVSDSASSSSATVTEPTANTSSTEDDNDVSTCLICCEPYTNSGEHRLCCLKCGHTYGKYCIEKWIKNEARCPQCNARATKKDVRVLYVKNLKALDTAERDRLRAELDTERETKRKLELKNAQLDQKLMEMNSKFKTVQEEMLLLKNRVGSVYRGDSNFGLLQASGIGSATSRAKPLLTLVGSWPNKDGECRVGAYDEWLNMLAISQMVKSPLYPLGSYGVKKMNLLDMRETLTTPLHHKEIRDLEFNSHGDVLLSVGLDKKAILTNTNTNITVQAFTADYPLWSCAWNKNGPQYTFYTGTSNGQILVYDIRNGREPIKALVLPSGDKTPTAGLKYVTGSYEKNSTFNMSGLLVQKLTSVWFCEIRNEEVKFHQLPLEGSSFLSVDFESTSRHALISTKASNKDGFVPSRHFVCNLSQYHSSVEQATLVKSNVVQSYDGSESCATAKLTRSSIFSTSPNNILVAADIGRNLSNVWNLADPSAQQTMIGREQVLDFVPCRVNNDFLLGSISSSNLNIYKVQP